MKLMIQLYIELKIRIYGAPLPFPHVTAGDLLKLETILPVYFTPVLKISPKERYVYKEHGRALAQMLY
jgi:hypothetical protein